MWEKSGKTIKYVEEEKQGAKRAPCFSSSTYFIVFPLFSQTGGGRVEVARFYLIVPIYIPLYPFLERELADKIYSIVTKLLTREFVLFLIN